MKYPDYVKKLITMGANLDPSETSVTKKILTETKRDINKLKNKNDPANLTTLRLMEMLLTEPHIVASDLQKITAKTLVLAGEKDIILDGHTRLIAKSIPKAEVLIFKGQTHFVPEENPALFNKAVLDFLAKP
ncbi:MAG TPA: alpha/beta hydrolase [Pedobacter sp.]|nr:alpha/beta hydrolase [Pedobacter sp.]